MYHLLVGVIDPVCASSTLYMSLCLTMDSTISVWRDLADLISSSSSEASSSWRFSSAVLMERWINFKLNIFKRKINFANEINYIAALYAVEVWRPTSSHTWISSVLFYVLSAYTSIPHSHTTGMRNNAKVCGSNLRERCDSAGAHAMCLRGVTSWLLQRTHKCKTKFNAGKIFEFRLKSTVNIPYKPTLKKKKKNL